jgi:LPXTG-motif cell wall-anchored protein
MRSPLLLTIGLLLLLGGAALVLFRRWPRDLWT